jgi:predicted secreted hydrolase
VTEPVGNLRSRESGPAISVPGDEWAHRGALHEWWYVNCHLEDGNGRRYGLVIAFFPDYMLAALVDKDGKKTLSKSVLRGGRLRCGSSGVSMGASGLGSSGPGAYALTYRSEEMSADLSLRSRKTPLMVNGSGEIREGLLGHSWYYALTDMSAEGEIRLAGGVMRVTGIAWIDRQWGDWEDMGIGGWEWFSLQFSNGWEVLATQIYSPVTMKACVRVLSAKMPDSAELHADRFTLRRLSEWRSPLGSVYGSRWEILGPDGIRIGITVDFDSQELHAGLWEGSCTALLESGSMRSTGVGYAEQVVRSQGRFSAIMSFAMAPAHFLAQGILRRTDLGVWRLLERLGVWRLAGRGS